MNVAETKAEWRRELRRRLGEVPPLERETASRAACWNLLASEAWSRAGTILFYHALPDELNLSDCFSEAIRLGKTVALPRFNPRSECYEAAAFSGEWHGLGRGAFSIPEPGPEAPSVPLNRLDLLLVPGLGFDRHGARLGRGKGFYDRLLAQTAGIKCGVCLDEQLVQALPREAHDIAMNCLLTPTGLIEASLPGQT